MPRARVYGGVTYDMTPPRKILRPVTGVFSHVYTRGASHLGTREDFLLGVRSCRTYLPLEFGEVHLRELLSLLTCAASFFETRSVRAYFTLFRVTRGVGGLFLIHHTNLTCAARSRSVRAPECADAARMRLTIHVRCENSQRLRT